ncbi:MAG: DNA ligase D [Parachlamydiaceae bacterium]|nr:DNA ligase D [Parachlamydiaceae bacterium]
MKSIQMTGASKSSAPKFIRPMLSTLVDAPPDNDEWIYEIKWDGYRALSICQKKDVQIFSRNQKSFNEKFYPILDALKKLNLNAVLDGEIVAVQESGLANFGKLQEWRSEADGQLIYYVFDILWLNDYDLTSLPLSQRKELLKDVIPKEGLIRQSITFDFHVNKILEISKKMGLEGIIAKKIKSAYLPGIRSHEWLKIKTQNRHEVVIGGYTINENSPKLFSALLVGVYENGLLHYMGKVGTGFNDKIQKKLKQKFKALFTKQCPFTYKPDVNVPSRFRPNPPHAEVFWLKPQLVCEVNYTEITRDGIMRHPSFKGMREDKSAKEVYREIPQPILKKGKSMKLIPKEKKAERKTLFNPKEDTQVKIINEHELKFNHLNKVYWPNDGITKRDLLNYYYQVAPILLPYLKDRPQSLNRFPDGIEGISFYQKDVTKSAPEWMELFPYHTSLDEDKNFLIVKNEEDIFWMANLGAIEMNPWSSTVEKPDYPTWSIIDIDPSDKNSFDDVIDVALMTKKVLDELKIEGFCKTSGATGMHIYIPLGSKYTYDQSQLLGRLIATQVNEQLPEKTSIERLTKKRSEKVYVDFLQNRPQATLASPYSVRPKPGATVSMPLHWDEVKKGLKPQSFTLKNAMERIRSEGDLFKPVIGKGINLNKALKGLES